MLLAVRGEHEPMGIGIKTAAKRFKYTLQALAEYNRCTYANDHPQGDLLRLLSIPDFSPLPKQQMELFILLSNHYLAHRFNLLGSGWIRVSRRFDRGSEAHCDAEGDWLRGVVTPGNFEESRRIWQLISGDYSPVDWQMDFKSGYRWSERRWFRLISITPARGVDIKVPWELSRMQYLPHLALAYAFSQRGARGFEPPEAYVREFRNQILDFIATNPPRYGANWYCAMDVAIRVVNWLIACDLFRAFGAVFDEPFMQVFVRSVYEHCLHILNHLEWSASYRNNHYLADIAGLLFCAAYLPVSPFTDALLAFAVQELVAETGYQFLSDGANFEASTCYHRLSAEIVYYCTALVLGLPPEKQEALSRYDHRLIRRLKPAPIAVYPLGDTGHVSPFPEGYIDRLHRMARFTLHLTKPSGQIAQIGDNDSGRFVSIQPVLHCMPIEDAKRIFLHLREDKSAGDGEEGSYLYEDSLNHSQLLSFAYGLFHDETFKPYALQYPLERAIAQAFCRRPLPVPAVRDEEEVRVGSIQDWQSWHENLKQTGRRCEVKIASEAPGLREGMRLYAYPDFGVYLFRSPRLYLLLRCGRQRSGQRWGHAHNDQLHVELWLDGRDVIRDPGTYLYEPLPELRNRYRSIHAHFTPAWEGREPCPLSHRVFEHRDCFGAECLYFGEEGIVARHTAYGFPIYRVVAIRDNAIVCTDYVMGKDNDGETNITYAKYQLAFSPGYGVCLNEPAVFEEALQWTCS